MSEKEIRILSSKETQLTLSSSSYYLKKGNINEQLNTVRDLNRCRINLEKEIDLNPEDSKTKYLIQTVRNMAEFLDLLSSWRLARKCYHSINYIPKAIEMYQKQVNNESDTPKKRILLIQMARYAYEVGQSHVGLQKFQEAYSLTTEVDELDEISEDIVNYTTEKIENTANNYLRKMMDKKFYTPLDKDDQIRIQKYAEDSDSLGWSKPRAEDIE